MEASPTTTTNTHPARRSIGLAAWDPRHRTTNERGRDENSRPDLRSPNQTLLCGTQVYTHAGSPTAGAWRTPIPTTLLPEHHNPACHSLLAPQGLAAVAVDQAPQPKREIRSKQHPTTKNRHTCVSARECTAAGRKGATEAKPADARCSNREGSSSSQAAVGCSASSSSGCGLNNPCVQLKPAGVQLQSRH